MDTRSGTYKRSQYGINYPYIFPDRKEIFDKIPTVNFGSVFTDLDGGPYPSQSVRPDLQCRLQCDQDPGEAHHQVRIYV